MNIKPAYLLIAAAFTLPSLAASAKTLEIKIGFAGPLTGNNADVGQDAGLGAEMAVTEVNNNPPIINGMRAHVTLMKEDDASDPRMATDVAQRLVDAHVNGVVGHFNSGASIAASKIYFDAHIPQLSAVTNPKYTHQGYNTTFRVYADDAKLGEALGQYAVQTLKAKRIAVVDDRTAYGQGIADEFLKSATAAGATVVSRQYTNDKAIDFRAILTEIKASNATAIFYGGVDQQGGPMLKQMHQLGMHATLLGGDGICTSVMPKLAGDALAAGKVICAEAGGITAQYVAGMDAFRADFRKMYGHDVVITAPYAYDSVMILIDAMKRANSSDPVAYLPALKWTDYKGIIGETQFDEHGDVKNAALTLYTFDNGQRKSLGIKQ